VNPPILCRCCGKPTATAIQRLHDGSELTLITCTNTAGKCSLCGYTFTNEDYFDRDISAYQWRDEAWKHRERIDRI